MSFHATSVRLETALAVQHESQWKLSLQPRTQTLTVHWLRVVRGDQKIDHLHRNRMRLLQRETNLEDLVLNGVWTLLVVLDDVRPGDVIEAAYSYKTENPIRPNSIEGFFAVPSAVVVAQYHFSVCFAADRAMQWRASADAPPQVATIRPDGLRQWTWQSSQLELREGERNTPGNFLDYIHIQISDLDGWHTLAAAVEEIWRKTSAPLESLHDFFPRPPLVDAAVVVKLIQNIQDNFRYLSLDLDAGGWTPASPILVAQRRYGDCKDLAWLAACVLTSWGVAAKPVLVSAHLRDKKLELLPMQLLFNHAILQVEIENQTRWFDLTFRSQGGTFQSMPISQYGAGLVIAPDTLALSRQPGGISPSLYAVRETFYLDTRKGHNTAVEIRVWTEGWQAENMRRSRLNHGEIAFEKERTELAQRRFGKASRFGALQWRDRREENVCELVETFEITDSFLTSASDGRALFDVPINLAAQTMPLPEDKSRRTPWATPFPFSVRHELRLKCATMKSHPEVKRRWVEPEMTATLAHLADEGTWTKIIRFSVKTGEVAADRLPVYRRNLEELLRHSSWRLYLPWGKARPSYDSDFGKLPPIEKGVDSYVGAAQVADFPDSCTVPDEVPTPRRTKRHFDFGQGASRTGSIIFLLFILGSIMKSCSEMPH